MHQQEEQRLLSHASGNRFASRGYLYSVDWATFNAKQDAITKGNLTEATSSVLTITGELLPVIGSGVSIQVKQASSVQSGYLNSTDWSTFNNKSKIISGTATVDFASGNNIASVTVSTASVATASTIVVSGGGEWSNSYP